MSYVVRATSLTFGKVVYLTNRTTLADRWTMEPDAARTMSAEEAVSAMVELQREDYPSWRIEIVWVDP